MSSPREKLTPPRFPLQRTKNPFIRRLSSGPVSLRTRNKLRLGLLALVMICIISVLDKLRCAKHACVTRVGFSSDVRGGKWVGGGSVVPMHWMAVSGQEGRNDGSGEEWQQHRQGAGLGYETQDVAFGDGPLVAISTKDYDNRVGQEEAVLKAQRPIEAHAAEHVQASSTSPLSSPTSTSPSFLPMTSSSPHEGHDALAAATDSHTRLEPDDGIPGSTPSRLAPTAGFVSDFGSMQMPFGVKA